MNARHLVFCAAAAAAAAACTPSGPSPSDTAQSGAAGTASGAVRTSWGEPRIEGTYTNKDEFGTPFERPEDLAGKPRSEFGPEQLADLMKARSERGRAM